MDESVPVAGQRAVPVAEPGAETGSLAWPAPRPALQQWLREVAEHQDERAFEQLYALLAPRVMALAQRILRDAAAAEEVVEDCFWQVWRQAARFDPLRGGAEAWVLTLARSRALDAWRARSRADGHCLSLDALREDGHPARKVQLNPGASVWCARSTPAPSWRWARATAPAERPGPA